MKAAVIIVLSAVLAAGCHTPEPYRPESVTAMKPGFGVMIANFKYVPGTSEFPQSQVIEDAKYTAERLAAVGYQPFIVYTGGNEASLGVRASSHLLAEALAREINRVQKIDLGDGNIISVPSTRIVNLAELKVGALSEL